MVLYIFPSELFIVFPNSIPSHSGPWKTGWNLITPEIREKKILILKTALTREYLRKYSIEECHNTIAGLQVCPEYGHPGIIPADI